MPMMSDIINITHLPRHWSFNTVSYHHLFVISITNCLSRHHFIVCHHVLFHYFTSPFVSLSAEKMRLRRERELLEPMSRH